MANVDVINGKLVKIRALFDNPEIQQQCSGSISAYLLPRTDAHQSEYLTARDSRIQFLTGFSGSNAFVIITKKEALLWTDGRYFIQARSELEKGWELMKEGVPDAVTPVEWLISNLSFSETVAFDPQLYSYSDARKLQRTLFFNHITVAPLKQNLVDLLWTDRPVEPIKQVIALGALECGVASNVKIEDVRKKLTIKKCQSGVFTALDDIAWLFNIRGADIPYNPVVFSIVLLAPNNVHLFIDTRKLTDEVRSHLEGIILHEYDGAVDWIRDWYKNEADKIPHFKVFIPDSTNFEIGSIFKEEDCIYGPSVIQTMKAVKNDVELDGMRRSHLLDSMVIVRFLCWLDQQVSAGNAVTEVSSADVLLKMRAEIPGFMGPSFDTIAAVDEHAALPHYRPTEGCEKCEVTKNCIYLLDSGGHYRTGTTDVTRTVAFGSSVEDDFKRKFTQVLKGHISTACLIYPNGTHGIRIDVMARQHLWSDGLDFGHGVGHGVGHFLNVHEGPAGIGFRRYAPEGAIHKQMVITIEPGFYLEGRWGIRIENCYEVVQATSLLSGAEDFLTFRSLTYVPIQKSLIDKSLLNEKEIDWLNNYHKACLEKVYPLLPDNGERKWLEEACRPL